MSLGTIGGISFGYTIGPTSRLQVDPGPAFTGRGDSFATVNEQHEVTAALGDAGVLAGVRWAYISATTRSMEYYVEADGHDSTLLGIMKFTLFRDRLDRVFGCERYAVHSGDGDADLDVLYAELSDDDIATMPRLGTDVVRRSNLNGSPGWAWGEERFLLASCEFGRLDHLPWPQKSLTKQLVALARTTDPAQPALFDIFAPAEVGGLEALEAGRDQSLRTFVVAHSLDPVSRQIELVLGRPRLNLGGGQAWDWRADLLDATPSVGTGRLDDWSGSTAPGVEPDAIVRVRAQDDRAARSTGER